jgi:DNA-binding winged helix-turn-helix (wHTH) protein
MTADEQMRDVGDQVLTWTGNRMEYLVFTYEELRAVVARDEPIVGVWVEDSVTVLGVPIESIIRDLATLGERQQP